MVPIAQVFRWLFGWQASLTSSTPTIDFASSSLIAKLAEGNHDDRVNFVRDLQSRQNEIKANFEASMSKLEQEQYKQYEPILRHLYAIVNTSSDGSPGIPDFWLSALKRHPDVAVTINKRDEEALSHLVAIRVEFLTGKDFRLCFDFTLNNYFTNKTLTKTYLYKSDTSGLSRAYSSKGDDIKWRNGSNLKQMPMQRRPGTKPELVTVASFFDFFTPPATPAGGTIITTEDWLRLIDFKIGEKIKQDIIPHAVDYYTGVAGEDYDKYSPHEGEVEYVNYGDIDDEQ